MQLWNPKMTTKGILLWCSNSGSKATIAIKCSDRLVFSRSTTLTVAVLSRNHLVHKVEAMNVGLLATVKALLWNLKPSCQCRTPCQKFEPAPNRLSHYFTLTIYVIAAKVLCLCWKELDYRSTCIELRRSNGRRRYRRNRPKSGVACGARRWACRRKSCATAVDGRSRTGSFCESWISRGTNDAFSAASACSRLTSHASSRTASSTANPTTNGPSTAFFGGPAVR